jgi:type IV secretory pathway VirB3-like protein
MSVDLHRIEYQEEMFIEFFDNAIELNFDNRQLFHYRPGVRFTVNIKSQTASLPSYWDDYFKSWPDLNEGHPEMFRSDLIIVVLSSLGYALPYYVDFPYAKSIQIIALGILTAVGYAMMRDLRICYQCIEYYTVGHSTFHKRLLKTANFIANGLACGLALGHMGIPLGAVLALAARATKYNPLTAHQITPYAAALAAFSFFITYIIAKRAEKFFNLIPASQERTDFFNGVIYPARTFHPVDLRKIPPNKQISWLACQVSNVMGYYFFCGGSLLLMVGVVAARFFKR